MTEFDSPRIAYLDMIKDWDEIPIFVLRRVY